MSADRYNLFILGDGGSRECEGPIPVVGQKLTRLDRIFTVQEVQHVIMGWERRGILHTAGVNVFAAPDWPVKAEPARLGSCCVGGNHDIANPVEGCECQCHGH